MDAIGDQRPRRRDLGGAVFLRFVGPPANIPLCVRPRAYRPARAQPGALAPLGVAIWTMSLQFGFIVRQDPVGEVGVDTVHFQVEHRCCRATWLDAQVYQAVHALG